MPPIKTDTRKQILDAAQARFMKYGFKKTNMMEIAEDCAMSPGNLYRFFESKDEMGAEVISRIMQKPEKFATKHLKSDHSPQQKLVLFTLDVLNFNYSIFSSKMHLFEMMNVIYKKRPHLPQDLQKTLIGFFCEVLREGHASGEIKNLDVAYEGELFYRALRVYLLPYTLMSEPHPLELLRKEAEDLIQLVYCGLKCRSKRDST